MRIIVDARNIHARMNGLGRYARHLLLALGRIDGAYAYTLVKKPEIAGRVVPAQNFAEIAVDGEIAAPRNVFFPRRALTDLSGDVYHSLFQFLPARSSARRTVVTLHDFMWIDHPRVIRAHPVQAGFLRAYARAIFDRTLARVDHAIAISESTRARAVELYPRLAGRITVIPHGVDRLEGSGDAADLPAALAGRPFVLVVGNSRAYKNVPAVVRAFARLGDRQGAALAIVGRGDEAAALRDLAIREGVADRVVFTGAVDNRALHALYRHAACLAFPSLVEGFGLPILEAMAHGCAVLTSRRPPMSDVAGDAALLVDPESVDAIADGLGALLNDAARRDGLRARGAAHARDFTWERAARATLAVYEGLR